MSASVATSKYMIVKLAGEAYGLPLVQLREIVADYEITVLPNLPEHFRGVIGLRGQVIPILDLRSRFELSPAISPLRPRVVVVELAPNVIGVEVDDVLRVHTVRSCDVERAPDLTCGQRVPFVDGVSEDAGGKLIIHLDIRKILSSVERIHLEELSETVRAAYESSLPSPDPSEPPPDDTDKDDSALPWSSPCPPDEPTPEDQQPA